MRHYHHWNVTPIAGSLQAISNKKAKRMGYVFYCNKWSVIQTLQQLLNGGKAHTFLMLIWREISGES